MKDYKCIRVPHSIDTPTAPAGYIAENGGQPRPVAADATYAAGVPVSPNGDPLWYRVTCNGTDVRVRVATTQAGLDTAFTSYRGSFEGKLSGGLIGFRSGQVEYIDNVTIRTDTDNDGVYETEEMIEQFNTDPVELRYDAAGNLTFDGNYAYIYDAWGRQVEVKHAFITKDANGTKTYHEGSTISTSLYDGRGRRIRKQITNSGDQNYTYIYYYDGYRIIEERNGSDQTIKTYVWGQQYVDELLQINTYIGTEGSYWAMQDANYNVIGIVNESGRQVERYEYTPYGQRTIYGRQTILSDVQEAASWSNDSMLTYPQLTSARLTSTIPVSLCDWGFQGKMHDPITGNIDYITRVYSVMHQRMMQNDLEEYIDGMNRFQAFRSNPVARVDPTGMASILDTSVVYLDPSNAKAGEFVYIRSNDLRTGNFSSPSGLVGPPRIDPPPANIVSSRSMLIGTRSYHDVRGMKIIVGLNIGADVGWDMTSYWLNAKGYPTEADWRVYASRHNAKQPCGPDCTKQIAQVLKEMTEFYNGLSDKDKEKSCDTVFSWYDQDARTTASNAWDIDDLYQKSKDEGTFKEPFRSVTVDGQCYDSAAVNYVQFGHIARLCGKNKTVAIGKINAWKRRQYGHSSDPETMAWFEAGYNGWTPGKTVYSFTPYYITGQKETGNYEWIWRPCHAPESEK